MVPKPIGMKSFAEFATGSQSRRRAVLRGYKYPNNEGLAMAAYYQPAKSAIIEFLREKRDMQWLFEKVHEIEQRSLTPNKSLRTKLLNNARGIRSYIEHFGSSSFNLLNTAKFPFHLNGVTVNVTPDIHVVDAAGTESYFTFSFCQKKIKHEYVRALVWCMSYGAYFHSTSAARTALIDVPTGTVHGGVAVTPELIGELSIHCSNLQAEWDLL